MARTIALSGVLSEFLANDSICIALTPLMLDLARKLRYDPVPHLLGLATASNVGSSGANHRQPAENDRYMIIGVQSWRGRSTREWRSLLSSFARSACR